MLLDPVGGIVRTLLRTTGSRNIRGCIGGGPVVMGLTLTVVGFLVATVLVTVLARSSTARWERARRAARKQVRARPSPKLRGILRSTSRGGGTKGRVPDPPVDDEGTDGAVPLVPERPRGAQAVGRDTADGVASRSYFRRTPRFPRRRALRFLHRHDRSQVPRVPHPDSDESPTPP